MGRREDLEQHIRESYQLIREYEEILRLSPDPKEKARAQRDIKEQRELIEAWNEEYQQITGSPLPDRPADPTKPGPPQPPEVQSAPKKPHDEAQRPIPWLSYVFVVFLVVDLAIALKLGWQLFGHQPELLAYLQVVTGFLGIGLEIFLVAVAIQQKMTLSNVLCWLGTHRVLQGAIIVATLTLLLVLFWPQISQASNQVATTPSPPVIQETETQSTSPLTTPVSVTPAPTPWAPCRIESFEAQPPSPQPVGSLVIFKVRGTCESGVRAIRLLINDQWYGEEGAQIAPAEEFVPTWPTKDLSPGAYKITAEVATWGDDDWAFAGRQVLTYTLASTSTAIENP